MEQVNASAGVSMMPQCGCDPSGRTTTSLQASAISDPFATMR